MRGEGEGWTWRGTRSRVWVRVRAKVRARVRARVRVRVVVRGNVHEAVG